MLILPNNQKTAGEKRCSLKTKKSKPCPPDSLLHRPVREFPEVRTAHTALHSHKAQIPEPGATTLRKGCKEIPKNGTPKNEAFCFTATQEPKQERDSPANIRQGAVSATFGHCFPGTDSYGIIIL